VGFKNKNHFVADFAVKWKTEKSEREKKLYGKTHMLAGATTAAGASFIVQQPINPVWVALATIGALIPDIDHEFSTVSNYEPPTGPVKIKPLKWIPKLLHLMGFKHRTITHCFLGWAIFMAITLPLGIWVDWGWWIALSVIGYGSHLITDGLTKSGIKWFYPFSKNDWHFLPKHFRVTTGEGGETAFSVVILILLAMIILLSISMYGVINQPDVGMIKVKNLLTDWLNWISGRVQQVNYPSLTEGVLPVEGR
jgi:membrane-bound metal-dependent hydrolase YbcI (DUF457 family)